MKCWYGSILDVKIPKNHLWKWKGEAALFSQGLPLSLPFPHVTGPGQGLTALESRTLSSLQKQRERQPDLGLLTLNPSVRARVWPAAQHPLTPQRTGSGRWHMAILRVSLHVPCSSSHSLAASCLFIP